MSTASDPARSNAEVPGNVTNDINSSSNDNNNNNSNNSILRAKEESKGSDKPAKVHVHVPPRIDDEWYQVDAPEPSAVKPDTEYSDWLGSHSALCSSSSAELPEVLGDFPSYPPPPPPP